MRYFIIDAVNNDPETELYECKDEAEFLESLYYNRSVAKDCGDKVETLKDIKESLKKESCDFSFNAFYYIKGEELLKDYGYEKGKDY